jgi:hypothetical protein
LPTAKTDDDAMVDESSRSDRGAPDAIVSGLCSHVLLAIHVDLRAD